MGNQQVREDAYRLRSRISAIFSLMGESHRLVKLVLVPFLGLTGPTRSKLTVGIGVFRGINVA